MLHDDPPAIEYTSFYPFCGLGGGAVGGKASEVRLFGSRYVCTVLGGIDNDPAACKDFEYLTGVPALCADISTMTPEQLRAYAGDTAPDILFFSPPCKGFSGLLGKQAAKQPKYRKLNRLVLDWTKLMLATWKTPPRLVLLENVPRISTRGKRLLDAVKTHLRRAGYAFHATSHDCGELGGLAQHRRRYLMVGRHVPQVSQMLYQPLTKRVRACGEVLQRLPLPGDESAGPMHALPGLSWINWVRLALIPAGGDWRDLDGVLADGQARREVFRRHHVGRWDEPVATVAGTGSNGPSAVADPRPSFGHVNKITAWNEPAGTVTTSPAPSSGALAVADPRIFHASGEVDAADIVADSDVAPSNVPRNIPDFIPQVGNDGMHCGKYRVGAWGEPANTVIGATRVGSGAQSVADPRIAPTWGGGRLGVKDWSEPAGTVTSETWPANGAFSVADPRVKRAYDHGYGVLRWDEASPTVAGGSAVGQGAYAVADIRIRCTPRAGAYGVIRWEDAFGTVTGAAKVDNGAFAVADPRDPGGAPFATVDDPKRSPFVMRDGKRVPVPVIIISADGTWHRPLTTLELAALQDLPMVVNGKPLKLEGSSVSAWRERVGNAVPPGAARAVIEQMLTCLAANDAETFMLSTAGGVWVQPQEMELPQ